MPKVRVVRDIVVKANDVATILYAAREEPYDRVPTPHAEIIEAAGAGRRLDGAGEGAAPVPPAPPGRAKATP